MMDLIRPRKDRDLGPPPVKARYLKKKGAKRGIWLINLESLLSYIEHQNQQDAAA